MFGNPRSHHNADLEKIDNIAGHASYINVCNLGAPAGHVRIGRVATDQQVRLPVTDKTRSKGLARQLPSRSGPLVLNDFCQFVCEHDSIYTSKTMYTITIRSICSYAQQFVANFVQYS